MHKTILLVSVMLMAAAAQQTRKEITNTGPRDAAANDPKVPDVLAISTRFDRVLILRFKYQTDLLAGLERTLKEGGVKNGVILGAFGSVTGYQVHQVSNRTFPTKNMFVADPTMPADIVTMSGYMLSGHLHPHISLATPDKSFGGHLEPGTKVFTFAVVTVGVLPDTLDLSRLDDNSYR